MERSRLIREMEGIVGAEGVIHEHEQLRTYECDGLMNYRVIPDLVVLPETGRSRPEGSQALLRRGHSLRRAGLGDRPLGRGLAGRVRDPDRALQDAQDPGGGHPEPAHRGRAWRVNMWVSQEVADEGYYYAPDPASQIVSSIGGNLAENSGGVHCLKYGFTTNHVMGAEVVLPDGSVTHIGGGRAPDAPGYDLLGAFVGSEGTLGIATRITLRLCRVPRRCGPCLRLQGHRGGRRRGLGDHRRGDHPRRHRDDGRLTMEAVEAAVHPGLPDAGAVLIIELDGPEAEVEEQFGRVLKICEENEATEIRVAEDDEERALFWKARKAAFGAMGRISNDYYVQDGVIPRTELAAVLGRSPSSPGSTACGSPTSSTPATGICIRSSSTTTTTEGEAERAEKLAGEIVFACLEHGGSLTGEHGIGRGQEEVHAQDVHRRRHERHAAPAVRLRSAPDLQPGQDLPHPPPLRRTPRPLPHAPLAEGRHRGAVLMQTENGLTEDLQTHSRRGQRPRGNGRGRRRRRRALLRGRAWLRRGDQRRDEAREPRGPGRRAAGRRHEDAHRRPAARGSTSS